MILVSRFNSNKYFEEVNVSMLDFSGINYLAVAVAWIINCAVGAFWYSPAGFAKKWEELTVIDIMQIPQKEATNALLFVVLSALVQSVVLAVIINSIGAFTLIDGARVGLLLWLGMVAATTVGVTLYSRRSWKFWWLNSGFFLIVIPVNSIILALWR
jgi:hypothetical protein